MENCLAAGAGRRVPRRTTGRSCSSAGPATNPLFGAFFEAVQQAGYALTDDVNGYRQEGFARVRPQHPPRPAAVGGARLPAPGDARGRTSRSETRAFVDADRVRGHAARSASSTRAARRRAERIGAGEVILCGGAINSPQLLQLSGVGDADELRALGIDVVHDLPGVGENLQDHLEVYIQHACTQPVSMAPYLKWRTGRGSGSQWLFLRAGPGATNHFEAGGFARSNDEVAYPNLMFHFLPIAVRYDGSAPAGGPRLPGAHRADVLGRAGLGEDHDRPTRGSHPALRFNYLSTEQDRREWVEAIRVARDDPRPARDGAVRRRRALARRRGRDRRGDPRLGSPATPRPRCTPRARAGWARDDDVGGRPADDARPRPRRAARRRRLGRCPTSRTATSTRR